MHVTVKRNIVSSFLKRMHCFEKCHHVKTISCTIFCQSLNKSNFIAWNEERNIWRFSRDWSRALFTNFNKALETCYLVIPPTLVMEVKPLTHSQPVNHHQYTKPPLLITSICLFALAMRIQLLPPIILQTNKPIESLRFYIEIWKFFK